MPGEIKHSDASLHQELILGCIQNDRKSQEELYRLFFPTMERMIRKYTQDEDQLIDIINDGFLKVFKKIQKYEGRGSFEGWIRRIVYHSLSDYFRKNKYDARIIVFDELKKEDVTPQSSKLYFDDLIRLVNELPSKHARVFHLFVVEGYKHREIANLLGIGLGTSRWYYSEARKLLQRKISKHYKMGSYEAI